MNNVKKESNSSSAKNSPGPKHPRPNSSQLELTILMIIIDSKFVDAIIWLQVDNEKAQGIYQNRSYKNQYCST